MKDGMALPVDSCHDRPSEALCYRFRCLQAALQASPSLAHNTPSPMAGV
ncbi:MAG: hypothetical protein PUE80_09280 [bacterium]|nr:hypothetical protein [bacterium]